MLYQHLHGMLPTHVRFILDDFDLARQAAHDYYPDATEVAEPSPSMYLLDGVVSKDERTCVNIMHDAEANTFARVVEERPDPKLVRAAELEMRRVDLIQQVELKAMLAFSACETAEEATACWGALASTVSQSARLRIKELGGDVDEASSKLETFFLTHQKF